VRFHIILSKITSKKLDAEINITMHFFIVIFLQMVEITEKTWMNDLTRITARWKRYERKWKMQR